MPIELKEAVRKRPGMYLGDIDYDAANNVVHELVANAIDLFLAGLATTINIQIKDNLIVVTDDGPGLPFSQKSPHDPSASLVEHFLTYRHNHPTADNHAPHVHVFKGGLGLAVLNAVAAQLHIESSDGNGLWVQDFGRGDVLSPAHCQSGLFCKGTRIELALDPLIFGDRTPDLYELRKTIFELAHFYPGLIFELGEERFHSKNGFLDLAYFSWNKPTKSAAAPKSFYYQGKSGDIAFQVAALGESATETAFRSWVNGCATVENGTHVQGLANALAAIGWQPQVALIHLVMYDPRYAGPCKDALRTPEVTRVLEEALAAPLRDFYHAQSGLPLRG
ncbi:ATP-binding protein [Methylovulum psychrotolerans]|uniref:DNA topoisomerase (ATP-hydrolyzing) n=1 Tax=Methylovulum psychrotolerans TaxID=1704499 RepID=A0A1Z4C4I2_9GAMM|nr:ATP-binding protein [Methylovulum psychrotolerans]ASF48384.1 hypothetical protein CEK71_21255 [Methylovulum psychrotolerans]